MLAAAFHRLQKVTSMCGHVPGSSKGAEVLCCRIMSMGRAQGASSDALQCRQGCRGWLPGTMHLRVLHWQALYEAQIYSRGN